MDINVALHDLKKQLNAIEFKNCQCLAQFPELFELVYGATICPITYH